MKFLRLILLKLVIVALLDAAPQFQKAMAILHELPCRFPAVQKGTIVELEQWIANGALYPVKFIEPVYIVDNAVVAYGRGLGLFEDIMNAEGIYRIADDGYFMNSLFPLLIYCLPDYRAQVVSDGFYSRVIYIDSLSKDVSGGGDVQVSRAKQLSSLRQVTKSPKFAKTETAWSLEFFVLKSEAGGIFVYKLTISGTHGSKFSVNSFGRNRLESDYDLLGVYFPPG